MSNDDSLLNKHNCTVQKSNANAKLTDSKSVLYAWLEPIDPQLRRSNRICVKTTIGNDAHVRTTTKNYDDKPQQYSKANIRVNTGKQLPAQHSNDVASTFCTQRKHRQTFDKPQPIKEVYLTCVDEGEQLPSKEVDPLCRQQEDEDECGKEIDPLWGQYAEEECNKGVLLTCKKEFDPEISKESEAACGQRVDENIVLHFKKEFEPELSKKLDAQESINKFDSLYTNEVEQDMNPACSKPQAAERHNYKYDANDKPPFRGLFPITAKLRERINRMKQRMLITLRLSDDELLERRKKRSQQTQASRQRSKAADAETFRIRTNEKRLKNARLGKELETPEQKQARLVRKRNYAKKYFAKLKAKETPEQLAARREYARKYMKNRKPIKF